MKKSMDKIISVRICLEAKLKEKTEVIRAVRLSDMGDCVLWGRSANGRYTLHLTTYWGDSRGNKLAYLIDEHNKLDDQNVIEFTIQKG